MSRYEATRPAKVAADDGGGDGNASFVQTCLNGLNALSAVYLVALAFVILDGDNLDKLFPLPGAIVSVSLGGSCSSCLSRS
nr:unnamed protein product [Digitaria exilis]